MNPQDYKEWTQKGFIIDYETGQVLGTNIPHGKYGTSVKDMHSGYKNLERKGDYLEAAKLRMEVSRKYGTFDSGHTGAINITLHEGTNGQFGWDKNYNRQFIQSTGGYEMTRVPFTFSGPSQDEVDSYFAAKAAEENQQKKAFFKKCYNIDL